MEGALWASVSALLADALPPPDDGAERSFPQTTALDYGAYFDLVLDSADEALPLRTQARQYLLRRLAGGESAPIRPEGVGGLPRITTLSQEFHDPEALDRMRRWWDIEPDNAMALTAISADELAVARRDIACAFDHLRACAPDIHAEIAELVNEIVVARPDGSQRMAFGGASSFALWGAIALNVDSHDGWPRYFQSLVHEAAHTLLFAIAREKPLVLNSPDEKFGSPLRDDLRPMDGLFHAAFVSVRESLALDALLCRHEAEGHLSCEEEQVVAALLDGSVTAFWECAETLRRNARLAPLGQAILHECEATMRRNFALVDG